MSMSISGNLFISLWISLGFEKSVAIPEIFDTGYFDFIRSKASETLIALLPFIMTFAPSLIRSSAVERPIPEVEPEINTLLPFNL